MLLLLLLLLRRKSIAFQIIDTMASENAVLTDATPTTIEDTDGTLRVYLGDDKKNLECRFYENQVSRVRVKKWCIVKKILLSFIIIAIILIILTIILLL